MREYGPFEKKINFHESLSDRMEMEKRQPPGKWRACHKRPEKGP
jgi:hypothetical protein